MISASLTATLFLHWACVIEGFRTSLVLKTSTSISLESVLSVTIIPYAAKRFKASLAESFRSYFVDQSVRGAHGRSRDGGGSNDRVSRWS